MDDQLRPYIRSGKTSAASFVPFLERISGIVSAAFEAPGPIPPKGQAVRAWMLDSITAATDLLEKAVAERVAAPFAFFACVQDAMAAAAMFGSALREPDKPAELSDRGPAVRDWKGAEALAVWHMRTLGFHDAIGGPNGNDRGADVHSAQAMAQVKHYSSGTIGAPLVQQAKGAAHGKKWVLFYALSGYTAAAQGFAEEAAVALFKYDVDGRVVPVSTAAHELTSANHQRLKGEMRNSESPAQQHEAQVKAQQLFDGTFARVMSVMKQAIAQADRGGQAGKLALKALEERHEVQRLVQRASEDTMSISDFLSLIDDLDACGQRAASALGISYRRIA